MADKVAVIAWLRKYAGAYTIPGVDNNELANWLAATPAPAPQDAKEQCSYCRHPLFAATKCHSCGYEPVQAATPAPAPLTDDQKGNEWRRLLPLSERFTSADWFEAGACFAEQYHGIGQMAATPAPAEPVCTCPSGDGSLRWPCPAHPPEATPAQAQQAKPLTEQEVAEAVFDYYQHFSDPQDAAEACFDKDLAMFRLAERACAEAWGVKLAGIGASTGGGNG